MHTPLRVAVNGASGRMGRALVAQLRSESALALKRAVVDAGSERVGEPLTAAHMPDTLAYVTGWEQAGDLDVVVDFSTPQGLASALDFCQSQKVALVTGTTGLDASLRQRLADAGAHAPILRAANFSLGVTVLRHLLAQAAAMLPSWDLEIIEAHHARKRDAPSGTALALGETAARARGVELDDVRVHERHGEVGERTSGSIGFAVVRGGDIAGEHTAMLAAAGERLELTHRATDRGIFARGALTAAAWLAGKPPGRYSLDDVLGSTTR